ncbi:hypothetical protein CDL15_Pgr022213 [Punica granatum]|uniref:Uncharacterized protein n=1 Tax=Punica granatum TaxID=22663 RepID=A0A218XR06_PUNGR|nr:hypothetical protein CDL15_Pgr022213 [Punica granatum]
MWTRSSESSKCGREVRNAVNVDAKSGKNLLDNGIRYATVKALICRRLVSLLGRLPVYWGYPSLVMWDSSSGVERLRIPRGRKSKSAIVPPFVVPVILT